MTAVSAPRARTAAWWLADRASLGDCSRRIDDIWYEELDTPPSVEETIDYPGTAGGMR